MSTEWKLFEEKCVNFLNKYYSSNNINFRPSGFSDSTKSDIEVYINSKLSFYIEAKMNKSQSGQFVLLNNGSCFNFSSKNKSQPNEFSDLITRHINKNYNIYKDVSTSSTPIILEKSVYSNWIINHYLSKNVKFLITQQNNGNFIIFPIEKFSEYFKISANFRVKTSGSRELSSVKASDFKHAFSKIYGNCNLNWDNKKAFIQTNLPIPDKEKITDGVNRYQLNFISKNLYHVKLLSNTNNPNVIFSIELFSSQKEQDLIAFEKYIL